MKIILEFDLPEETEEHRNALHGLDYLCVLQELDNWLRNLSKYRDIHSVNVIDVRNRITKLCDERNVDIWQ